MSKVNQIKCDKCGNLISNDWETDHNEVRYRYVNTESERREEIVDLCEKCIYRFRILFTRWLGDK